MRGFAISFLTLARVASSRSLLAFLCSTHRLWHRDGSRAVPFRTVAKRLAGYEGDVCLLVVFRLRRVMLENHLNLDLPCVR
jgi:hypothetical protein